MPRAKKATLLPAESVITIKEIPAPTIKNVDPRIVKGGPLANAPKKIAFVKLEPFDLTQRVSLQISTKIHQAAVKFGAKKGLTPSEAYEYLIGHQLHVAP